jgi:hypothetical protein
MQTENAARSGVAPLKESNICLVAQGFGPRRSWFCFVLKYGGKRQQFGSSLRTKDMLYLFSSGTRKKDPA